MARIYMLLIGLFLLNVSTLLAQTETPDWKVDSLLQVLGHPSVSYEFNFNFSLSDLSEEGPSAPSPLANMTEEELKAELKGSSEDAKVYAQLVYRGLAEENAEKILDALQKGAASYQEYINTYPEDSLAVEELAMMMMATQNYDYAMETLDYGIQKFPKYAPLHVSRFQVLFYYTGKLEMANSYIDSLLQTFPDNETLAYMGFMKNYQFHIMQHEGEIVSIDGIMLPINNYLERKPSDVKRLFLHKFCKAYLYMNIKVMNASKNEQGEMDMMLASPKDFLKEAYIEDLKSIITFLETAEKEATLATLAIFKVSAMCHILLGEPEKAEKRLKNSLDITEDEEKVAAEEALALLKLMQLDEENKSESIKIVEEKYKRTPAPKDLVILAWFCHLDEQPKKAMEYAQQAIEKYPSFGLGWEMKAYLALSAKDFLVASTTFEEWQGKSEDPVYGFLLNVIYTAAKEGATSANQALQELLDAQPENEKGLAFRKLLQE